MSSEKSGLQAQLLDLIEKKLRSHESLAGELSKTLGISMDAAYRRIRGETPLNIVQTQILCVKHEISLDRLMHGKNDSILFHSPSQLGNADMAARVGGIFQTLQKFAFLPEVDACFLSMEFPIYHLLQVPELASFKMSYWNSLVQDLDQQPVIELNGSSQNIPGLQSVIDLALRIPTIEIVSETAWNSTLKQILFFLEAGRFAKPEDALLLLDKLRELTHHLKRQAAAGVKHPFESPVVPAGNPAPGDMAEGAAFQLFYNEMIFSQTLIYLRSKGKEEVLLEHNLLDFIATTDPAFCRHTRQTLDQIMKKSIPISKVAERERHKFFRSLEKRVQDTRKRAEGFL